MLNIIIHQFTNELTLGVDIVLVLALTKLYHDLMKIILSLLWFWGW